MMASRPLQLAFLILLGTAACSSSPTVRVDYDLEHDFSAHRTYAWRTGTPADSELVQKRIVAGVDAALAARGLEHVETGTADLLVRTEVGAKTRMDTSGGNVRVGVGISRRGRYGSVGVGTSSGDTVRELEIGTLAITLSVGSTGAVVWRADAEEAVNSDAQQTNETIAKAIEKAFRDFPPARAES